MKKRSWSLLLAVLLLFAFCIGASADKLSIKPLADPWDDPQNQTPDGGTYYADNDAGYIVIWETPECSVEGKYMLLNNGAALTVEYRVAYMDGVPWGFVTTKTLAPQEEDREDFSGWVLMTDLVDENGERAYAEPTPSPSPTPTPAPSATPQPANDKPSRPDAAITVGSTFNNAIVYTSVAIAVVALAVVAYLLIKHKALNKKEE